MEDEGRLQGESDAVFWRTVRLASNRRMDDFTASAQNKDTMYEDTDTYLARVETVDLPRARRDARLNLGFMRVRQLMKEAEHMRDLLFYELLTPQQGARCALRLRNICHLLKVRWASELISDEVWATLKRDVKLLRKVAMTAMVCVMEGSTIRFKSSLMRDAYRPPQEDEDEDE